MQGQPYLASLTWIPEKYWKLGCFVNEFTAYWHITQHDESLADLKIVGEWSADGIVWDRFDVFGPIPAADSFFYANYTNAEQFGEYLRVGVEFSSSTAYAKTATLSLDFGYEIGLIGDDETATLDAALQAVESSGTGRLESAGGGSPAPLEAVPTIDWNQYLLTKCGKPGPINAVCLQKNAKPVVPPIPPAIIWAAPPSYPRNANSPLGSEQNPHLDLQLAVDSAGPGTTIVLRPGDYARRYGPPYPPHGDDGNDTCHITAYPSYFPKKGVADEYGRPRAIIVVRVSGTQGKPITIRAEKPGTARLYFKFEESDLVPADPTKLPPGFFTGGKVVKHLKYVPYGILFSDNVCHVNVRGLVLMLMSVGVRVGHGCAHIELEHLEIKRIGASRYIHFGHSSWLNHHNGIVTSASTRDVLIRRCELAHFGVHALTATAAGAPHWLFDRSPAGAWPKANLEKTAMTIKNKGLQNAQKAALQAAVRHGYNHSHALYLQGFGIVVSECTIIDITQGYQLKIDGNILRAGIPDLKIKDGGDGKGQPSHTIYNCCFGRLANPAYGISSVVFWRNPRSGSSPKNDPFPMLPPKNVRLLMNTFHEGTKGLDYMYSAPRKASMKMCYGNKQAEVVSWAPIIVPQHDALEMIDPKGAIAADNYRSDWRFRMLRGAWFIGNHTGAPALLAVSLPNKNKTIVAAKVAEAEAKGKLAQQIKPYNTATPAADFAPWNGWVNNLAPQTKLDPKCTDSTVGNVVDMTHWTRLDNGHWYLLIDDSVFASMLSQLKPGANVDAGYFAEYSSMLMAGNDVDQSMAQLSPYCKYVDEAQPDPIEDEFKDKTSVVDDIDVKPEVDVDVEVSGSDDDDGT